MSQNNQNTTEIFVLSAKWARDCGFDGDVNSFVQGNENGAEKIGERMHSIYGYSTDIDSQINDLFRTYDKESLATHLYRDIAYMEAIKSLTLEIEKPDQTQTQFDFDTLFFKIDILLPKLNG